jgi:hypothetical protein
VQGAFKLFTLFGGLVDTPVQFLGHPAAYQVFFAGPFGTVIR